MKARILIIVENLPVPFDSRVWKEACWLRKEGYQVTVLCPKGKGYVKGYDYSTAFTYTVTPFHTRARRPWDTCGSTVAR